ncbi:MAG: UbiA family prenyltransferase [Candidatus Aenigmarchaeota archaeon]|nr:UbiA family prenyltransferase [Candidatus Aenigmarchaeota archaeon]
MSSGILNPSLTLVMAAIAYALSVGSFNMLNNIFDVKSDRLSKPDRPLASMEITTMTAFKYYILTVSLSLIIAYFVNFIILISCVFVIILSILYSVHPIKLKRFIYINTILVSACYSFIPLSAGWLLFSGLQSTPWYIFGAITSISFIMVITKDIQDVHADNIFGVSTIPIFYGIEKSGKFMRNVSILIYTAVFILILSNIFNYVYFLTFIPLIGILHLSSLIEKNSTEKMGKVFLRRAGLIGITAEILFLISYIYS